MAAIYDMLGNTMTEGLQGSTKCDEAIIAAQRLADQHGVDMHLVDDDGEWIVHPIVDGKREAADPYVPTDGGNAVAIEVQHGYLGWRARLCDEADEDGGGWCSPHKTRDEAEAAIRDYAYRRRGLTL